MDREQCGERECGNRRNGEAKLRRDGGRNGELLRRRVERERCADREGQRHGAPGRPFAISDREIAAVTDARMSKRERRRVLANG